MERIPRLAEYVRHGQEGTEAWSHRQLRGSLDGGAGRGLGVRLVGRHLVGFVARGATLQRAQPHHAVGALAGLELVRPLRVLMVLAPRGASSSLCSHSCRPASSRPACARQRAHQACRRPWCAPHAAARRRRRDGRRAAPSPRCGPLSSVLVCVSGVARCGVVLASSLSRRMVSSS